MSERRDAAAFRAFAARSLLFGAAVALAAGAAGQTVTRISVDPTGGQVSRYSNFPVLSQDARAVAFVSASPTLVFGDGNGATDVFVRDIASGATAQVSVDSNGVAGDGDSGMNGVAISGDGRYVCFASTAINLVTPDLNGSVADVYVFDRESRITRRVSVGSSGVQANAPSHAWPMSLSSNGRFVAFWTASSNLVSDDGNGFDDVFVHDLVTAMTTRESVSSSGAGGFNASAYPAVSADGRFVAFGSSANNLVPGDTNGASDIFVHDRVSGVTSRASVSSSGQEAGWFSEFPRISEDGRYVAFDSLAPNLVSDDANGARDVFVHDRQRLVTERVSIGDGGVEGTAESFGDFLWNDGRFVVFSSLAGNLVRDDGNSEYDVFVRDRSSSTTTRLSVSSAGTEGNGISVSGSVGGLSVEWRFAVFTSSATNLVVDDTNGVSDVFLLDRATLSVGSVLPASGSESGGDLAHVYGSSFNPPSEAVVRFGGTIADRVEARSDEIVVRTPPGSGVVDVSVRIGQDEATVTRAYTYVAPALAVRLGNVNVGRGDRDDVLYVNGSRGDDVGREVHVPVGASIQMVMARPSSRPGDSRFALYVWPGPPRASTLAVLPRGLGVMAFRPPFADGHPIAIWNNAGHAVVLGAPTLPSSPAPSVVFRRTGGAPQPRTVTFQGLIEDDGSQIVEGWSITNAIVLRIQ